MFPEFFYESFVADFFVGCMLVDDIHLPGGFDDPIGTEYLADNPERNFIAHLLKIRIKKGSLLMPGIFRLLGKNGRVFGRL